MVKEYPRFGYAACHLRDECDPCGQILCMWFSPTAFCALTSTVPVSSISTVSRSLERERNTALQVCV